MAAAKQNSILKDARKQCNAAIKEGFDTESPVLVDALPAMGKSSGVIRWAAKTENSVAVFTERHELYDQYEKWAQEHGLTAFRLPSHYRDCPTAKKEPEFGEDWKERFDEKYRQGKSAKWLHDHATECFGQPLPCQIEGGCELIRRLNEPIENYDILIGHFRHTHKSEYVKERYVVLDEFAGNALIEEFESGQVSSSVTSFIYHDQDIPYQDWDDLYDSYDPENPPETVERWLKKDPRGIYRTLELLGKDPSVHQLAPIFTRIALTWERLDNRWRRAELDEGYVAVRNPRSGELSIFHRPELGEAKSILALDGTPSVRKWETVLGRDLVHIPVLSDEKKREYVRDGLGLRILQTTNYAKPYLSGRYVNETEDMALIEAVVDRSNYEPAIITSKSALQKYRRSGLDSLIPRDRQNFYWNERGSNEFETVRCGIVIGSPHPSNGTIEKWGALAGQSIEKRIKDDRQRTGGMDTDFGSYGNEILHCEREDGVLQAIMRFGRKEKDGERGATVYVHTGAIPSWVSVEQRRADFMIWDGEHGVAQVVTAIKTFHDWRNTEFRTKDIEKTVVEQNDISPVKYDRILRILHELQSNGFLNKEKRGREYIWRNNGLENAGQYGHVSFE